MSVDPVKVAEGVIEFSRSQGCKVGSGEKGVGGWKGKVGLRLNSELVKTAE